MFHVQTYIYFPIVRHKFTSFPTRIPVDDTVTLRRAKPYLDLDRFEGYIELTYYGQPILTHKLGDFIIDYWCYLVEALEDYIKKGSGRMYLPDQPIPIEFEEKGLNWVLMIVGEAGEYGKWLLSREELIKALIKGAVRFFKGLYDALGMIMLDKIILRDCTKNFWKSINDISAIKLYFKFKPIRESCRGKIQMMFQDNPVLSLRCGGHPNDSMKAFFSSSSSLTRDFPFFLLSGRSKLQVAVSSSEGFHSPQSF